MKLKYFPLLVGIVVILLGLSCQRWNPFEPPDPATLIAWYPFSGDAKDASGNKNDGKVHGAELTEDRFGQAESAYYFDGNNNYIEIKKSAGLKPSFPMTIAAWIQLEEGAYYPPIFMNDYCENSYFGIMFNVITSDNLLSVSLGDGGEVGPRSRRSIMGTTHLQIGQWYHVAAVIRSETNMTLFVNGKVEEAIYDGDGDLMVYGSGPARIGFSDGSREPGGEHFFKGKIDEIYLFNRALANEEVLALAKK